MRFKSVIFFFTFLFLIGFTAAQTEGQIGKAAPDFELQKLDGSGSVSLSKLRGKVILIDFWASWCAPCKKSLPYLAGLHNKYKALEVIAINVDDEKENGRAFLEQMDLKITAVFDDGKKVVGKYNVPVMPTAYLVDQYGKIQYIHSGYDEKSMKKLEFAIRGLID
jgi:thiol-disulfide isomerase/thioredoxin